MKNLFFLIPFFIVFNSFSQNTLIDPRKYPRYNEELMNDTLLIETSYKIYSLLYQRKLVEVKNCFELQVSNNRESINIYKTLETLYQIVKANKKVTRTKLMYALKVARDENGLFLCNQVYVPFEVRKDGAPIKYLVINFRKSIGPDKAIGIFYGNNENILEVH